MIMIMIMIYWKHSTWLITKLITNQSLSKTVLQFQILLS